MWRCLALVAFLVPSAKAFVPAPIRWGGLPSRRFVLAPQRSPSVQSQAIDPQKLAIWDQRSRLRPRQIPTFIAKPDKTIVWDQGLCVEAIGVRSGDAVGISRCTGGPTQLWNILPFGGEQKKMIQLKDTSLCINVKDDGVLDGAPVELQECGHETTESWQLEEPVPLPTQGPSQHLAVASLTRHVLSSVSAIVMLGALSLSAWFARWPKRMRVVPAGPCATPWNVDHGGICSRTGLSQLLAERVSSVSDFEMCAHTHVPALMTIAVTRESGVSLLDPEGSCTENERRHNINPRPGRAEHQNAVAKLAKDGESRADRQWLENAYDFLVELGPQVFGMESTLIFTLLENPAIQGIILDDTFSAANSIREKLNNSELPSPSQLLAFARDVLRNFEDYSISEDQLSELSGQCGALPNAGRRSGAGDILLDAKYQNHPEMEGWRRIDYIPTAKGQLYLCNRDVLDGDLRLWAAARKYRILTLLDNEILSASEYEALRMPGSIRVDVRDQANQVATEDLLRALPNALNFIDISISDRCPVVMQSAAGQSRAVIVVLAHKMVAEGLPLAEAFGQVITQRPQAMPNLFFMKALAWLDEKFADLPRGDARLSALHRLVDSIPADIGSTIGDAELKQLVPGYSIQVAQELYDNKMKKALAQNAQVQDKLMPESEAAPFEGMDGWDSRLARQTMFPSIDNTEYTGYEVGDLEMKGWHKIDYIPTDEGQLYLANHDVLDGDLYLWAAAREYRILTLLDKDMLSQADYAKLRTPGSKRIDVRDNCDQESTQILLCALPEALDFIDMANARHHPVVMQSAAGQSRAVAVALAYKMVTEGLRLAEAFAKVVAKRPQAMPNPYFMKGLVLLDKGLVGLADGPALARRNALESFLRNIPVDVNSTISDVEVEDHVPGYSVEMAAQFNKAKMKRVAEDKFDQKLKPDPWQKLSAWGLSQATHGVSFLLNTINSEVKDNQWKSIDYIPTEEGQLYVGNRDVLDAEFRLWAMARQYRILTLLDKEQLPSADYRKLQIPGSKRIDVSDKINQASTEVLVRALPDALDFIASAFADKKPVIVQSAAGQSRCVVVALVHMMVTDGLPLAEALAQITAQRPRAMPNHYFMKALALLDGLLLGISRPSERRSVLNSFVEAVPDDVNNVIGDFEVESRIPGYSVALAERYYNDKLENGFEDFSIIPKKISNIMRKIAVDSRFNLKDALRNAATKLVNNTEALQYEIDNVIVNPDIQSWRRIDYIPMERGRLYLSNQDVLDGDLRAWATTRKYRILTLLDKKLLSAADYEKLKNPGGKRLDVRDEATQAATEVLLQALPEALDFINEGVDDKCPVIIQSSAGKSRAVVVVLVQKIVAEGLPLSEAFAKIVAKHPQAKPNPFFMKALALLDDQLGGLPQGAARRTALEDFIKNIPEDIDGDIDNASLENRVPSYSVSAAQRYLNEKQQNFDMQPQLHRMFNQAASSLLAASYLPSTVSTSQAASRKNAMAAWRKNAMARSMLTKKSPPS